MITGAAAMAVAACLAFGEQAPAATQEETPVTTPLQFTMNDIDGNPVDLSQYKGKVVLIVNVASKCGHTKQYKGLQKLYTDHHEKGLVILGFPCNQFGGQEPGTEEEIAAFCEEKYGVTFPLFSKVDVNGKDAAPLFQYLTGDSAPLADKGPVKWNFEKFLINRQGELVQRFRSKVTPESEVLVTAIDAALAEE